MPAEVALTVRGVHGLHARPAARFVETAQAYQAHIELRKEGRTANAKSLIALLSLGVNQGSQVTISASGPDEAQALAALRALLDEQDA